MSSTLPARAAALRASLVALDAMASNVQETGLLTDLRNELAKEVDAFDYSLAQCQLLAKAGIPAKTPSSVTAARARAANLRDKLAEDTRSATLKKGTAWTTLLREIGTSTADASSEAKSSWRDYRAEVFTGDPPAVVRGRIAWTDQNRAAFQRYETKYQAFRAAFEIMPSSEAEISRAKQIATELKAIAGEFDFNVPAEVKAFLAAVQLGGATLTHLTPAVVDWLKLNNAYASYRIVPAR